MTTMGIGSIRYDAEKRPVRMNDGAFGPVEGLLRRGLGEEEARGRQGPIHYLRGYEKNVGNGMEKRQVHGNQGGQDRPLPGCRSRTLCSVTTTKPASASR